MKHGEWLPWCRENLKFDRTTAFRYMKIFDGREMLHSATFGPSEAYRLLSQPAEESEEEPGDHQYHGITGHVLLVIILIEVDGTMGTGSRWTAGWAKNQADRVGVKIG